MTRLSESEIRASLGGLAGWEYRDAMLTRQVTFPSFAEGISFVNRVAAVAEQVGHHPDITIKYSTIGLSLSTHDAGGVTQKDVDLAQRISGLLEG